MSIGKGEVVVILGPSGSGKTTLLRTINFLDAADEGSISVSGFEVDAKKHSKSQVIELRRKTAMVFKTTIFLRTRQYLRMSWRVLSR